MSGGSGVSGVSGDSVGHKHKPNGVRRCPVCPTVSGDICPADVRMSEVSEDIKGHMSGCPVC